MTGTAASTTPGVDHLVAKEGHADLMGWAEPILSFYLQLFRGDTFLDYRIF